MKTYRLRANFGPILQVPNMCKSANFSLKCESGFPSAAQYWLQNEVPAEKGVWKLESTECLKIWEVGDEMRDGKQAWGSNTVSVNFLGLEVFLAPTTAWAARNQPRTPEN